MKSELSTTHRKASSTPCWFIFYTRPRTEKIIRDELSRNGYENYLPTTKTTKIWKNRQKKIIEKALFPGYIFVYIQECEIYKIVRFDKIVTYLHVSRVPSVIDSDEIERLKKLIEFGQDINTIIQFSLNKKVRIISGPLLGVEGILIKQKGKMRFGIQIEHINQALTVEIDINQIEQI
jgi:transcription antitermination factor NusG